ncbi:MAG: hypothetical protein ABW220_17140 [Burkholderiaceae bacterium]
MCVGDLLTGEGDGMTWRVSDDEESPALGSSALRNARMTIAF